MPRSDNMNTNLPKIILKLDDVCENGGQVAAPWQHTFEVLGDLGVAATLGLSGKDICDPSDAFLRWLTDQANAGHEIWNHGFAHDRPVEAQAFDGAKGAEFRGMPLKHQLNALRRTQELAAKQLGLTLTTFGAPFNATDAVTANALEQVDELSVWLFKETPYPTSKLVLPRIDKVNIEYPVHQPDFKKFRAGFEQNCNKDVLVLQGHPNSWIGDLSRFSNFKEIVGFLIAEGVEFVTPRAWAISRRSSS